MKIAFLSCDSLAGYVSDDEIMVKFLKEEGHDIQVISWSSEAEWSKFDCAIIRTTWDYVKRHVEFVEKLKFIGTQTKLYNDIKTVEWNIHKGYLLELEKKGVMIVPTIMFKNNEPLNIPAHWKNEKFVVKPAISATSYQTHVLDKEKILSGSFRNDLGPGDWLCQPFVPHIVDGEFSLVYFGKKFSHALAKVPKSGDFRVQEEFGGEVLPYKPSEKLLALGEKIMSEIPDDLLYGRIDVIPFENHYALMELELIEPSLYFRTSKDSPQNFIKALKDAQKE
jgi:glutathione synthase/RimK-type ligase-like ATP-grasp enzyme